MWNTTGQKGLAHYIMMRVQKWFFRLCFSKEEPTTVELKRVVLLKWKQKFKSFVLMVALHEWSGSHQSNYKLTSGDQQTKFQPNTKDNNKTDQPCKHSWNNPLGNPRAKLEVTDILVHSLFHSFGVWASNLSQVTVSVPMHKDVSTKKRLSHFGAEELACT